MLLLLLLCAVRCAPELSNELAAYSPPPTPNKPNPNPKQYNMAAPKDFTTENLLRSAPPTVGASKRYGKGFRWSKCKSRTEVGLRGHRNRRTLHF